MWIRSSQSLSMIAAAVSTTETPDHLPMLLLPAVSRMAVLVTIQQPM
jgi:hypothetical protein